MKKSKPTTATGPRFFQINDEDLRPFFREIAGLREDTSSLAHEARRAGSVAFALSMERFEQRLDALRGKVSNLRIHPIAPVSSVSAKRGKSS